MEQSFVTSYGPNRSVVRMVATRLPIDTGRRIYIQLPHMTASYPPSPSVSSHGGTFDLTSLIKDPSMLLGKQFSLESIEEETACNPEPNGDAAEMSEEMKATTTKRISSLEAELARLKAQIATYALSQAESMDGDDVHVAPPVPPPLPPPPPPVLPPSSSTSTSNTKAAVTQSTVTESTPARPPLSSVLKDIGSVKLRTLGLERSPGGTPLKPKKSSQTVDTPTMDDPASIIAHALRKKFSHRIFQDSPDKENLDRSESSFSEFDTPITGTPTQKTLQFTAQD